MRSGIGEFLRKIRMSRGQKLKDMAEILREHLGLKDEVYFPIVELLEVMCEIFILYGGISR